MSTPRVELVALDLDGTLVDSAPDIAHCLGRALEAVGRLPPGEARTRDMGGSAGTRAFTDAIVRALR